MKTLTVTRALEGVAAFLDKRPASWTMAARS
jgi:hypothetical protein